MIATAASRDRIDPDPNPPTQVGNHLPTVNIGLVFEGPRIDRLEAIWDVIGEYGKDDFRLVYTRNRPTRMSHAELFAAMWQKELDRPNRYAIFSELDFLPSLDTLWLGVEELIDTGAGLLACKYSTRHPETRALICHPRLAGGWFLCIDKERVGPNMQFDGRPDPCNQLPDFLAQRQVSTLLLTGQDAYPRHYGIEYPMGVHLFWSRHLHDDPACVVSGFRLGDIQKKHDQAVNRWVRKQPPAFQALLHQRSASSVSALFSESTASTGT